MTERYFWTHRGGEQVDSAYRRLLSCVLPSLETLQCDTCLGRTVVVRSGDPGLSPVVYLHDADATVLSWLTQLRTPQPWTATYAVELVGEIGRSAAVRPPLSSGVYASWLTDLVGHIGGPVALVGEGLGGFLALDFAMRRPDLVRTLHVVSPLGLAEPPARPLPARLTRSWMTRALAARLGPRSSSSRSPSALQTTIDDDATAIADFARLRARHYRPRTDLVPRFRDVDLRQLTVPVTFEFACATDRFDAAQAAARVRRLIPHADVRIDSAAGAASLGCDELPEWTTCP